MGEKKKITVFITKSFKFRAKIEDGTNPPYEVTIGGESWKEGKGLEYKNIILQKMNSILTKLSNEYSEVN